MTAARFPTLTFTLAFAALALAAGCGDDSNKTATADFEVSIVRPAPDAVLYAGVEVTLSAEVAGIEAGFDTPPDSFAYDWSFGDGGSNNGVGSTVTHTYAAAGPVEITVTARDADGATATVSVQVEIVPPADLEVSSPTLSLDSALLQAGDTFRVSVDLRNRAAEVPAPFGVGIYIAGVDQVDPATTAITVDNLGDLITAGAIFEIDIKSFDRFDAQPAQTLIDDQTLALPDDLSSGDYWVFVFADPDNVVGELDESNNVAFAERRLSYQAEATGVDLIVRGVNARPFAANSLGSLTVGGVIANSGNEPANLTEYNVWLSAGNPVLDRDEDTLLTTEPLESVPAGGEFAIENLQIPLDPPITELGSYFVIVEADPGGVLDEADKSNNVSASNQIVVTDEPVPGVDLVPSAFAVLPATTFLGGSIQIDVTVSNLGTDGTDVPTICRIYFSPDESFDAGAGGDTLIQTLQTPGLDVSESVDLTVDAFVPGFIEAGVYFPFVQCDAGFLVAEADEDNNVAMAPSTIEVAGEANVDLVASGLSIDPLTVENEGTVTASVDVCNEGSNGSTPSVIRISISEDALLDANDTVLLQSRVPPVDAGDCVTIRADVPAVCDTFVSEYTVFALADATGLVEETDEENNQQTLEDELTIEGVICDCENDDLEPNDAPATAKFLNPDRPAYPQRTMCGANVDYYLIPLLEGETIRATATFDNDRGNLDVDLFALDFSTLLDSSATDGDLEEVSFIRVPARGNYLLRVRGRTPDDRNVYDLDLAVSAPAEGVDLIVLDVSVDNERPVLGETLEVCFDVVNLGDSVVAPTLTRIYLSEDTSIDPVDDIELGELAVESFEDRLRRCVDVQLPDDVAGGPRYVGVLADARDDVSGELDEDNNAGVSPVFQLDDACFDALEPNNSLDAPGVLELLTEPPVLFSGLLVCSENRDFYSICLDAGEFLTASVAFDADLTGQDIDLKLYDGTGEEIDRSEGIGGTETVQVDFVSVEQCYTLEVFAVGPDREIDYEMTIDSGNAPDELACSRAEEPNEGFGAALRLRDFLDTDLEICPVDDADYYYVNLSPGSEITVRLVPADGEDEVPSHLRMALWGPARNFLTNTISSTEPLTQRVALNGRHFLRVASVGDGPRSGPYRIEIEGIAGVDLVPSAFTLETDVADPGQTVRFDFTLSNTRDTASGDAFYGIFLSTDPVLSGDDRLLREIALPPIDGITDRLEGRRFDVPADLVEGGSYWIILQVDNRDDVEEFSDSNNVQQQPLWVAPRCAPDLAEPNNFPIDAFDAVDAEGEPLTSCGTDDQDWYVFDAVGPLTTISLDFLDADGDLNLLVLDDTFETVGISDSITDGESVEVTTSVGADYYLFVEQHTDRSADYTLTID